MASVAPEANPKRVSWWVHLARGLISATFATLVGLVGLELDKHGFALVDTFDRHVGDLPTAYGSPRAERQREDIAIVTIEEASLLDYEARSPIDRRLIAALVRAIDEASPRAIGVNFIFDRRTPHDAELIAALKGTKAPLVLATIDTRIQGLPQQNLDVQAELIRDIGRPIGHNFFARKQRLTLNADSVVRYIAPPLDASTPQAFADVLASVARIPHRPKTSTISWQRAPDPTTPLFPKFSVQQHKPAEITTALAFFTSDTGRELLRNRIVILGADLLDTEKAATPLSALDGALMPGTLIHAQALAQRIDGNRDVWQLDWRLAVAVIAATTLGCFLIARVSRLNPQGIAWGLLGLVVIGAVCFFAFRWYKLELPSIALATAWAAGGFGGFAGTWVYRQLGVER